MGVDYGLKRTGIAFSDLSASIATGFEVHHNQGVQKDVEYLCSLAKKMQVEKVVFGLPLNADGSESNQTILTKNFAQSFAQASQIPIDFEDERFSSLEAEEILSHTKLSWQEKKKILDKVAAEVILQNYLNKIKRG